jgi:dienelactone hydrolase
MSRPHQEPTQESKSLLHAACESALLLLFIALASLAEYSASAQENLQPGTILPKITTLDHADQSYALYLPSNYAPDKRWPIVYAFDPAARGAMPVELMKSAAEKYGYILAGSDNSRNGSWTLEAEAAQAMFQDTRARLFIDDRRIYFAGFSGGARVSAALAQRCKCAAGIILTGAGFQPGQQDPQSHRS